MLDGTEVDNEFIHLCHAGKFLLQLISVMTNNMYDSSCFVDWQFGLLFNPFLHLYWFYHMWDQCKSVQSDLVLQCSPMDKTHIPKSWLTSYLTRQLQNDSGELLWCQPIIGIFPLVRPSFHPSLNANRNRNISVHRTSCKMHINKHALNVIISC